MIKKVFLILICLPFFLVNGQDSVLLQYSASISILELKEHVKILASQEFEGRDTGKKGQKLAAQYIKEQFVQMDLEGPSLHGDPYFQEFSLIKGAWQNLKLIISNDTLSTGSDLHITGKLKDLDADYDLVFVGYGIDHEKYSDFESINVKGKVVAFIAGEPKDKKGKYLISGTYLPEYTGRGEAKATYAYNNGAVAAIRINPDHNQIDKTIRIEQKFRGGGQLGFPFKESDNNKASGLIHIGINDASRIFGVRQRLFDKAVGNLYKGKKQTGAFNSKIKLASSQGGAIIETENIVALLPGTDLSNEYVIITAHFDHLGIRDNNTYYGADDNATGTAAVIEIAEAFSSLAKAGIRPKRSILFMPVTGEERGLLGSRYYVSNPLFPIKNTLATINMDMIGRSDNKHSENTDYVYVYISDSADSQIARTTHSAEVYVKDNLKPEYQYISDRDYRMNGSDHASFEDVNVPVLYFFCGIHDDYHRPTDTWDKIEYEKFAAISRMVFISAWKIANK
ncbi:MAG: M28 family peptidase [Bacteroidales bacterium]|nr:M28 family peptidase [Bacteroidales bacterium]